MISPPLKQSNETSWSQHLKYALSNIYGTYNDFKTEIETIEQLRNLAITAQPTTTGLAHVYKYYAQIEMISLHLPTKHMKTEFSWHEINSKETITQHSLSFERACILFNLGSILCSLGINELQKGDIKQAYHYMCCSSGIFKYASEKFQNAPSVDISVETFEALYKLMQAQAQHCFFLKAKESNLKNYGLLAKLGQGAVNLYHTALDDIEELFEFWGLSLDELDTTNLEIESHLFQASQLEKVHKTGDAIAHLLHAKSLMTDKNEISDLKQRLKVLTKDNDMIYHELVPSTCPTISETVVAKPILINNVYPSKEETAKIVGRDLFEKVIPLKVHEKSSVYSEFKAQFLRDKSEHVEMANMELVSSLEYMQLPQACHNLTSKSNVSAPQDLIDQSVLLLSKFNKQFSNGIECDFQTQRDRIVSLLRMKSSLQDVNSQTKIQQIKQALLMANKQVESLKQDVGLLKLVEIISNPKDLDSNLKNRAMSVNLNSNFNLLDLDDDFNGKVMAVKDLVEKLMKIKHERNQTHTKLRQQVHDDDITTKISLFNGEDVENELFKPELEKFSPLVNRIQATIRLQKAVLNDLAQQWKQVVESQQAKNILAEQESVNNEVSRYTEELRMAFNNWNDLYTRSKKLKAQFSQLERDSMEIGSRQPPLPPKQGMSSYTTPSAYDPSMYR